MLNFEYEIDLSGGTHDIMLTSSCVCPGQEAVFRCLVHGQVTTIWKGSALENCSDGSVILRHSQFGNHTYSINKTCGTSGQVIGQAISAENGSYTSQLTINITQQTIGSSIVCALNGENNHSHDIQITAMSSTGT